MRTNVTNVRGRGVHCFWSTVRLMDRELAKGLGINMVNAMCQCVCRRKRLTGRVVHGEKVREIGKAEK